jgi:ring-1,2-phenylacetyl-CoA epoxidase subunit PaaD
MTPAPVPNNYGNRPRCPFCGATEVEMISLFGSQLLTQQYYCRACHTPFERLKDADVERTPDRADSYER